MVYFEQWISEVFMHLWVIFATTPCTKHRKIVIVICYGSMMSIYLMFLNINAFFILNVHTHQQYASRELAKVSICVTGYIIYSQRHDIMFNSGLSRTTHTFLNKVFKGLNISNVCRAILQTQCKLIVCQLAGWLTKKSTWLNMPNPNKLEPDTVHKLQLLNKIIHSPLTKQ